jgi:predicted RecA/RadA family phage recombinase
MYNAIQTSDAPSQRKYNGDYGFPFVATTAEVDAGSVIVRDKLIGVSHRNVEAGQHGTAELQGTVTINKLAATVFTQGAVVYWHIADKLAVTAAGAGIVKLGICKFAPSTNATTVEVLINAVSNA